MSGTKPFNRRFTLAAAACAALSVAGCNSPPEACSLQVPGQGIESFAAAPGAGGTGNSVTNGTAGTAPSAAGSGTVTSQGGTGAVVPLPPAAMDFVLEDFEDGDGELSAEGFSGGW